MKKITSLDTYWVDVPVTYQHVMKALQKSVPELRYVMVSHLMVGMEYSLKHIAVSAMSEGPEYRRLYRSYGTDALRTLVITVGEQTIVIETLPEAL